MRARKKIAQRVVPDHARAQAHLRARVAREIARPMALRIARTACAERPGHVRDLRVHRDRSLLALSKLYEV